MTTTATVPVWLKSLGAGKGVATVNSNPSADDTALEDETLRRERRWVFVNEVPFVCKELRSKIGSAMELLSPTLPQVTTTIQKKVVMGSAKYTNDDREYKSGKDKKEPPAEVIPAVHFESTDTVMRGAMRIDGWNINEAEFLIRSPKWNKNTSFRTIVSTSSPLKIYQLHSCYNFLKGALEIVSKLERMMSATKDLDSHIEDVRVNKIMEDVSRLLKSAMEELLFGTNVFPDSTLFVPTAWQPNIPQDLMIECNIGNKEIIVSCYCMHLLPTKPLRVPRCSVPPRLGETVQCSRNGVSYWGEIVDVAQVRLTNERIISAFNLSNMATQLCTDLRDKLAILT
ncbi:hypothetical protein PROFUN_10492 [Planoprotostelium fungivorum]|uniref:Uncharacterized protein n=1 Tax=Planoprotostelium fungivorum TaxID=1890364 RepID=A0A2P6NDH0_9EUKA|nr:hypothetical protein PROFUN_13595 [Planoprotostelium fungivorum]PRP81998.1 hypothetical protein PROFUN_10492 [Planoprotostelium fungivorum]